MKPNIHIPDIQDRFKQNMASVSELREKFGHHAPKRIISINKKQAMILDYLSVNPWLAKMELTRGIPDTNIGSREIQKHLTQLKKDGAITANYKINEMSLQSLFLEIRGNKEQVVSLVTALLETLPTCQAMITSSEQAAYILGRFSGTHIKVFFDCISDSDAHVRVASITSWRSYMSDFYQRILKDDGKWYDDTSEMFLQRRAGNCYDSDEMVLPTEYSEWAL